MTQLLCPMGNFWGLAMIIDMLRNLIRLIWSVFRSLMSITGSAGGRHGYGVRARRCGKFGALAPGTQAFRVLNFELGAIC